MKGLITLAFLALVLRIGAVLVTTAAMYMLIATVVPALPVWATVTLAMVVTVRAFK